MGELENGEMMEGEIRKDVVEGNVEEVCGLLEWRKG